MRGAASGHAHWIPRVEVAKAPIPGPRVWVGERLQDVFVGFSVFKEEVWTGALQHLCWSRRRWKLMKTISLALRRSRASCLHENKPGLRRHVLERVRCSGQEAHPGTTLSCPTPSLLLPGLLGRRWAWEAFGLAPSWGRDRQARDYLQTHPGNGKPPERNTLGEVEEMELETDLCSVFFPSLLVAPFRNLAAVKRLLSSFHPHCTLEHTH